MGKKSGATPSEGPQSSKSPKETTTPKRSRKSESAEEAGAEMQGARAEDSEPVTSSARQHTSKMNGTPASTPSASKGKDKGGQGSKAGSEKAAKTVKEPAAKGARGSEAEGPSATQSSDPEQRAAKVPKGAMSESDKSKNAEGLRGRRVKVHVSRFVEYQPHAVAAMAYDGEAQLLAVARGNGDIQLWSTIAPRWHPIATLVGSPGSKIRSVCWAKNAADDNKRLFSASLDGRITEWSLSTLRPSAVTDSYGGSIWAMAVSHSADLLAIACHDGGVRIFELDQEGRGAFFKKGLAPHPGQSLSVAWAPNDKVLVSGDSEGNVFIWSLGSLVSKQTVSVLTDSVDGRRSPSLVWAVTVLADLTVFAGDSKGRTSIIDGQMGLVIKSMVGHNHSDVLALVSDKGDVFSAGLDGRVVYYRSVTEQVVDGSKVSGWVISAAARFHTHDVWCLCLAGKYNVAKSQQVQAGRTLPPTDPSHPQAKKSLKLDRKKFSNCLLSGGLDTQICLYTYDRAGETQAKRTQGTLTQTLRLPPWPLESCVKTSGLVTLEDKSQTEVRMLVTQAGSLDLWRWKITSGHGGQGAEERRGWVDEPRYALKVNTNSDDNLTCAAISKDGQWVAFSFSNQLSIYKLSLDSDGALDVEKCQLPRKVEGSGANSLTFLSDSRRLAVAQPHGLVSVVELDTFEVQSSFRPSDYHGSQAGLLSAPRPLALSRLEVSQDGQWLATFSLDGSIHIWSLESGRHHASLPQLPARVTAMRFAPPQSLTQQHLVLVTAENKVYLFEVEGKKLSSFPSGNTSTPDSLVNSSHHCWGLTFNPMNPSSVILCSNAFLCHVDFNKKVSASKPVEESKRSRKRKGREEGGEGSGPENFKIIDKYSPIIAAEYLSGDNLLIVERPWLQVIAQLGGTLYRKRFGR